MAQIQNVRGISYAGAYLGYGFHEDGFRRYLPWSIFSSELLDFSSGLQAAEALGAELPFNIRITDKDHGSLMLATIFEVISKLWIFTSSLTSLGFFIEKRT